MVMGRSCSEENGEAERVRSLTSQSIAYVKKLLFAGCLRSPFKNLVISLFRKDLMVLSTKFGDLLEKIFKQYEEKLVGHQGTDLMDALLEAYRGENVEFKISRNHMKSIFADLLFAGTDSLAQSTQWTLAEIINNPRTIERLREEIDSHVGKTRLIQESDLPNLHYLQAVVKEGLRLHPPASLFARISQEGCMIGGFYMPEDTTLIVNTFAVMRDPDYWEDPDEFKPERFLASPRSSQENEREQLLIKYIPFGIGRRGCPGENLAYIFIASALGTMVQRFDWKIEGEKVNLDEAVVGLTLTMGHPLKCTPVSRPLYSL